LHRWHSIHYKLFFSCHSDVIRILISDLIFLNTGAAGRIAYSLIPLICNGSVFGNDRRIVLCLIDIEFSAKKLEGVVMEIQDAGYDLLDNVSMTTDANIGFVGANVAILLGKRN
jgi:malate/lactate dehydrogenase